MKPLMTDPLKNNNIRVPKGYRPPNSDEYEVEDGDNWNRIAKRIGLDTWDLIYFNFKTRNPREVNWYLKHYVGCDTPTPDGKNWKFSSTANPGKIYIPRKVLVLPPITIILRREHKPPITEKLIESETDVTAGSLKVNDAYDLALFQRSNGQYILSLHMKLQFFFKADTGFSWTRIQKRDYIQDFERVVRDSWDNILLKVLANGKTIKLRLSFTMQIEGWMADHWELTVHKVKKPHQYVSNVRTKRGNVEIAQNDSSARTHFIQNIGAFYQITNVHEFAHMLGIDDEYPPKYPGGKIGPYNSDYESLLWAGMIIRKRHTSFLKKWLNAALKKHGII